MRLFRLCLQCIVLSTLPVAASAQSAVVTGTLTYAEAFALPPTAVVDVWLEDVTRVTASPEVVTRARFMPVALPIPFELAVARTLIDPGRRYGVRARILQGERVLFESDRPAPVLTQGRGSDVELTLRSVSRPEGAPAAAPTPALVPAGPLPAALRNLPASFAGTRSSGASYHLDLFDDDAYFSRSETGDRVGSWVRSSDGRAVMLDTGEAFLVAGNALQPADGGRVIGRLSSFSPIAPRGVFEGIYRVAADGSATFVECASGQPWAVDARTAAQLAAATSRPGLLGGAVLAAVDGVVSASPTSADPGLTVTVSRVGQTTAGGRCAPRFAASPLHNTFWRLTRLGDAPLPASSTPGAGEVGLVFRDDVQQSFGGTSGCQRLAGGYLAAGDALSVHSVGTLRACDPAAAEATFRAMLEATRAYRILGHTLELFDAERRRLARFESNQ